MKLTRDSLLWSFLILGAVFAYLGTMPPPWEWTYAQWIQSLAAVVATISGILRNSWLKGAEGPTAKMPPPAVKAAKRGVIAKKGLPFLLLPFLLGVEGSCAKAPPSLSPEGVAAFNALRVVRALDVVRDTAIDAEAQVPPLISTANTRTIINFHEAALKTIAAAPGGWKATVLAGLDQLKADILPAAWARIRIYIDLLKVVIAEVAP